MLVLPEEHRSLFKEPFGELFHSIEELIPKLKGKVIYTVGDVVTHNLRKYGISPSIAIVDGYTMRSPCSRVPEIHGECIRVKNPAGTLTDELIHVLEHAVKNSPATIIIDGEEDLAVIPLVLAAPEGAVILYGQPLKGVVMRTVDQKARITAASFLTRFVRKNHC